MNNSEQISVKPKWINTTRGYGFFAGFLLNIGLSLAIMLPSRQVAYQRWVENSTATNNIWLMFATIGIPLFVILLVLVIGEFILTQFGFNGFRKIPKSSSIISGWAMFALGFFASEFLKTLIDIFFGSI
jgi:hypothetical protein